MVRLIVDGGFAISDRSLKTGKKGSLKGGKQVNYLFFVSFF